MKRVFFILILLIGLVFPGRSFAAEILNNSEIFIGVEKEYSENLYIGAVRTIVEGDILEDLVIIGGEVKVTGKVYGDVLLLGGKIDFSGSTVGDLRIVGGEVSVAGVVEGDVLVIGGEVKILPSAVVNKEIFAVGGNVIIENNTSAELRVLAGKVFIDGEFSGVSDITTQNLQISPVSKISGMFSYYAPHRINENNGVIVSGQLKFNEINTIRDSGLIKKVLLSFISFWFLLRFITTLILSFILVYMFKVFSQEVSNLAQTSFWKSFLAGLLVIFVSPILVLISFVSLVAMPIGFLFLIAMIFISIISPAISGIFIGNYLKKHFKKDNEIEIDFQGSTIGVFVLTILQFVPYVGGWALLVFAIVSIGAVSRHIRAVIVK